MGFSKSFKKNFPTTHFQIPIQFENLEMTTV